MICFMHDGDPYGYLKVNHKVILPPNLARMVGATLQETEGWLMELEEVGAFSRDEHGCIFSRRMVNDELLRNKRAAGGKLGGNPALKVGGRLSTKVNRKPTPSSSSSTSSSIVDIHTAPVSVEKAIAYGQTIGMTEDAVRNWHDTRSRDGWLINGQNGARPVMSWQHDMATAKTWRQSQPAGTNGKTKGKHAGIEQPELTQKGF
jgi:hypothetical protein